MLGLPQDASSAEIRAAYLSSLLALHPDKHPHRPSAHFLQLQQAWTVLKDPHSKSAYDYGLNSRRLSAHPVADDVLLEDMSREPAGEGDQYAFFFPCRCGDSFAVLEQELDELGSDEPHKEAEFQEDGEKGRWDREDELLPTKEFQEVSKTTPSEVGGALQGHVEKSGKDSQKRHPYNLKRRSLILPCGSCSLSIRLFF